MSGVEKENDGISFKEKEDISSFVGGEGQQGGNEQVGRQAEGGVCEL